MSIDALVSGRPYSKPEARVSSGGKHFVCFKLLAADADYGQSIADDDLTS